ncbi:hypothetical protein D3C81_1147210 [compost metagenome]
MDRQLLPAQPRRHLQLGAAQPAAPGRVGRTQRGAHLAGRAERPPRRPAPGPCAAPAPGAGDPRPAPPWRQPEPAGAAAAVARQPQAAARQGPGRGHPPPPEHSRASRRLAAAAGTDPQRRTAQRLRGGPRRLRPLPPLPAGRGHRQRQDRGLPAADPRNPRGRQAGAGADPGDQPRPADPRALRPPLQRAHRPAALGADRPRAPGGLAGRPRGPRADRHRHPLGAVHPAQVAGTDHRRRGTRRLL